ncbi:MAG: hypothetical protein WBV39_00875 [Rudaea sp.]
MSSQRYYFSVDDLAKARGQFNELSFNGSSPDSFAALLQSTLREPTLWHRWKAMQPDPDAVDPALGASDPQASVSANQSDMHTDIVVTTSLPHAVLKHRLTLLIGSHWRLHDVKPA